MVDLKILNFDWDEGNRYKCQKHGLSIRQIESLFKQENIFVARDIFHSQTELRFLAIGRINNGRSVFVVFCLRNKEGKDSIRPVSARYMHGKEARKYEKKFTNT